MNCHQATNNSMLHQQTSMCSPMSPVLGAQNLIDNPSNQLLRSKSLNDISNSSLVLATDLSIDFQGLQNQHQQHHQQRQATNNLLDNANSNLIASYDAQKQLMNPVESTLFRNNNGTSCMPITDNYDVYPQAHHLTSLQAMTTTSNNYAFTDQMVQNQFNQQHVATYYRDPNANQCSNSNKQNISGVTNTNSPTHMFNICNSIVMNLNGVTEQIGNLHL